MEIYRYDKVMSAAPRDIFQVVDDDEKLKGWSAIFEGSEYSTDDTRRRGTRFRT